jgi:hypothetical protein
MADWYDFDKKMALINLNQIHEYAVKLDNIVTEETELEEWVKMKLTRIEQNVADVKKSLEGWEKFEEFGEGGRIFKKQLLHIAKYAKDLIAMIKLGSKLMSWQENKLAVSAEYIDAIYHHLDYKMGNRASDIKFADGGEVGKFYVISGKLGKAVSEGFETEEEAKVEMYNLYEKTKDFSYSIKKYSNGGGVDNYRVKAFTFNDDNQPKKEFDFYAKNDREAENKLNELIGKEYYQLVKVNRGDVSMTFENGKLDWDSDRKKYANGGGIKTDLNELENTELRNVLISFWNDFFNNHIGNYLSIEKENYILSNIDNVFVIVRDKDKGNFSDVEKQKIDRFLSPYFDSNKKPLFADFFNNYEIKDNKIIIYIKDMYANGGGVGRVVMIPTYVVKEIKESVEMGYDNLVEGMIGKKRKGVMLINKDYEVRGTYDIGLKEAIQDLINKIKLGNFKVDAIESKYAKGGGVGDYSEYSNDALKDMIINLSRYENTEGDIKIIKEELERRKSMYFVGGSVNEISKNQLENMVGKKLDGWNDDIVYYNGKKYQKCYLRPYYKVC